MTDVSTIGLDLAKKSFQVHGVDASGTVLIRRALRRDRVLGFFAKLPLLVVLFSLVPVSIVVAGIEDARAG